MRKALFILICSSFIFACSNNKSSEIPEYIYSGKTENRVYKNSFFNLKIDILEDWVKSIVDTPEDTSILISTIDRFVFFAIHCIDTNYNDLSLAVLVENLDKLNDVSSDEEFNNYLFSAVQKPPASYYSLTKLHSQIISDKKFQAFKGLHGKGDLKKESLFLTRTYNNIGLIIHLDYSLQDENIAKSQLEKVSFN